MRGRTFFFSLALGMVLVSRAHASGRVALRWSAPAECPTEETVLAEVERLLGARAPSDEAPLDVVAEVRRKDDGAYVVRLEIPGADGPRVREVSALSCVALGQATALILAMMIDPEAALTAPPNPAPSAEPSIEPPKPKPIDPGKPAENSPPSLPPSPLAIDNRSAPPAKAAPKKIVKTRRPPLLGAFHLVADGGSLPKPTFGFGGAIGIVPGSWKLEAGLTYFFEKSSSFSAIPNAGARVDLLNVHVASGRVISLHPQIEIVPRIRLDMGRFHATSFGVSAVDQGSSFSFGVGAGGILSVRISKYLRTGLEFDGIGLVARPRFIVTGVGVAHEPKNPVWRLALATEVQF